MHKSFLSVFRKFEDLVSTRKNREELLTDTAALLKSEIPHYDWVGFYLLDFESNTLILGPYSGASTEHTHIPVGRGICGQVAESCQTMIVQDVTEQDNYLACSMEVQSEIVVPIVSKGRFVAEIDIDSHAFAPFTADDELFLKSIAALLANYF